MRKYDDDFKRQAVQKALDGQTTAAAKQYSSAKAAIAVGNLTVAEEAAKEKNPSKVVSSLKAAGEWALDLAKEVGKDVVWRSNQVINENALRFMCVIYCICINSSHI